MNACLSEECKKGGKETKTKDKTEAIHNMLYKNFYAHYL